MQNFPPHSVLSQELEQALGIVLLSAVPLGDMLALYPLGTPHATPGLWIVPRAAVPDLVRQRAILTEGAIQRLPGPPPRAWNVDPLVHVALSGDERAGGFVAGRSLARSPQALQLEVVSQNTLHQGKTTLIRTVLMRPSQVALIHELSYEEGNAFVRVSTQAHNVGDTAITLELLSSFSLGGLTPFAEDDAPDRLKVHRFRSDWSAEGRQVSQTVEELNLERSWTGHGVRLERFGQVGSLPVRGWFPFVAVEDCAAQVTWAAQLSWAGSWQLELHRQDDLLNVSGGLADREFGAWWKTLAPGETFQAPQAILTVTAGGLDDACDRLRSAHEKRSADLPSSEQELPVVFNEWCSSWGENSHASVLRLADHLQTLKGGYFVIDAGWYRPNTGENWGTSHGDWQVNRTHYPGGLEATAAALRERGLRPGLWFEFETVGRTATAFSLTDHLLSSNGHPVTSGGRRFWNLADPWVRQYLTDHVVALLRDAGFEYLKVDYNDSLGIGVDGHESPGEGLRQQIEGTYAFFDLLRLELPELVIENCASGGHRLEPSMLARSQLSSFSDAHETKDIPIIAANVARLVPGGQSLIWAVLHPDDDQRRLHYSLAATFLGRMCLSGPVDTLSEAQWDVVKEALTFQREIWPLLGDSQLKRYGPEVLQYRYPRGWQGVLRIRSDQRCALLVLHSFADAPTEITVALPFAKARIVSTFGGQSSEIQVNGDTLTWTPEGDFCGCVVVLHWGD